MSGHGGAAQNAARVVTPNDVERFTEGDCHFLARAILMRTGGSLMAFTFEGRPDLHAFVRLPDGRIMDVEGICTLRTFRRRWKAAAIAEFDWPTLRLWFLPPNFGRYTYQRAHLVADRLLASAPELLSDSGASGAGSFRENTKP